jgi:hypothetical protein
MKNTLLLLGLAASLIGCHKPGDPSPDDPAVNHPGTVKPVGQPLGPTVTQRIGPAGGTVTSPDGSVTLTIPAGALAAETPIGIHPITRTTPGGVTGAYRFSPDGQQFSKPVSLIFTYAPDSLSERSSPKLLVAYQNAQGVWMAVPGAAVDAARRTITAPIRHFSDWSVVEPYALEIEKPDLLYGESTNLRVMQVSDLVQLSDTEEPLFDPVQSSQVQGWEWSPHEGLFINAKKQASYVAPADLTDKLTVIVSVKLRDGTELDGAIYVSGGFINLDFDGTPYVITDLSAIPNQGGWMLSGHSADGRVSVLLLSNGNGGPFGDFDKGLASQVSVVFGSTKGYNSDYLQCEGNSSKHVYTAGSAGIKSDGKVVEGSFGGQLAYYRGQCNYDFKKVGGTFRIKLHN